MPSNKDEQRSAIIETFHLVTIVVVIGMMLGLPFVLWAVIMAGLYLAEKFFG